MITAADREGGDLGAALGAGLAILVSGALVGLRDVLSNTSVALILVFIIVAAATVGGRRAGLLTAVAAGVAFDFFQTRSYNRLTVSSADDITWAWTPQSSSTTSSIRSAGARSCSW